MVRSLFLAVALFVTLAASAFAQTTWPGCTDSVPAPASAVGYNTEIFCDHFANGLPTVDVNNVCGTSTCTAFQFNWFAHWGWTTALAECQLPNPPGPCNGGWTTVSVNPSTSFANHTGGTGLDYTGVAGGVYGANGSAMMSCAYNGVAHQWYGIAVPAASYVRWETFSVNSSGTAPGTTAQWEWPTEFVTSPAPGPQFVEVDDQETYILKHFDWDVGGISTIGNGQTQLFGSGTPLVFGKLVVKMADNSGTGYLTAYSNDSLSQPAVTNPLVTWTNNTGLPGLLETQHMCLLINGPTGITQNIKSVQVFSKYALTAGMPTALHGGGGRIFR